MKHTNVEQETGVVIEIDELDDESLDEVVGGGFAGGLPDIIINMAS